MTPITAVLQPIATTLPASAPANAPATAPEPGLWISLKALRDLPLDPQSRCRLLQLAALQAEPVAVATASPLQLQLEAAEATVSSLLDALEQQQWTLAVERQNELRSLIAVVTQLAPALEERLWRRYGELLASLVAALHPRLTASSEDPLEPRERAELCWQLMELLEDGQRLPLQAPPWLAVLEQQLVQDGAEHCRQLIDSWDGADERSISLSLRLAELLQPAPLWLIQRLQDLLNDWLTRAPLQADDAAFRDCCRRLIHWLERWPLEAEGRKALGSCLKRLELSLQLLDHSSASPAPATAAASGTGPLELVVVLSDAADQASLTPSQFNLAPLLAADGPTIDRELSAFIQRQPASAAAAPAGQALLESLQRLWRQGRRLPIGSFAQFSYSLEAWRRQLGDRHVLPPPPAVDAPLLVELEPRELAVLLALSRAETGLEAALVELRRQHHNAGFWLSSSGPEPWYAIPTALDGLRALQARSGFYASAEAPLESLRLWGQACMALLLAAECWSSARSSEGLWLALAQQVQARGAGLAGLVGMPPPRAWLAGLAGLEVVYVGWEAETLQAAHRSGALFIAEPFGLRSVQAPDSRHPLRPDSSFGASLERCLAQLEDLHRARPFQVVCTDAGAYRLPLLQALRQRYGVRGLATTQPLLQWLQGSPAPDAGSAP